mgnify:CR=1 FL=1
MRQLMPQRGDVAQCVAARSADNPSDAASCAISPCTGAILVYAIYLSILRVNLTISRSDRVVRVERPRHTKRGRGNRRSLLISRLLVQIKSLLKAVNASASIYKLLLTGKERMALGTNLDRDILLRRRRFINRAASTTDRRRYVLRMDSFLHSYFTSFRISLTVMKS